MNALRALGALPVVATNRDGVLSPERNDLSVRDSDAGFSCELHRRVFDERNVDRLAVKELQNPLRSANFDERLRFGTAEAPTRGHQPQDRPTIK